MSAEPAGVSDGAAGLVRPGPRYPHPAPQCASCSLRTICNGCRHDAEGGCDWCYCDGLGCGTCGTKCRSHEQRELWQADTGSLELQLWIKRQAPLALPSFIPSVKPRVKMKGAMPRWTYTIPINDLIRTNGEPREVAWRIRDFFPEGSQLILNFFAEDMYLEPIWTMGSEFWEGEWLDAFDAIMGVNYSLYGDDSSFEIMNCMRRMQESIQEINNAGRVVIPLLAYVEHKQVYEQVECYSASNIHTVVINFQTVTGVKERFQKENVDYVRWIAKHTPWRVIANGLARPEVIAMLREFLGDRLIVTNADAYFTAMRQPGGAYERRESLVGGMRKYTALAEGRAAPSAPDDTAGGRMGGTPRTKKRPPLDSSDEDPQDDEAGA